MRWQTNVHHQQQIQCLTNSLQTQTLILLVLLLPMSTSVPPASWKTCIQASWIHPFASLLLRYASTSCVHSDCLSSRSYLEGEKKQTNLFHSSTDYWVLCMFVLLSGWSSTICRNRWHDTAYYTPLTKQIEYNLQLNTHVSSMRLLHSLPPSIIHSPTRPAQPSHLPLCLSTHHMTLTD